MQSPPPQSVQRRPPRASDSQLSSRALFRFHSHLLPCVLPLSFSSFSCSFCSNRNRMIAATSVRPQKSRASPSARRLAQSPALCLCKGSAKHREFRSSLSSLLSRNKSKVTKILLGVVGTSPGIFSLSSVRLSLGLNSPLPFLNSLCIALLHSFPCASIRLVRRADQGQFIRPSPPPLGDPGAAAAFSFIILNLPGAGPRPNSSARTSPVGGLYEELCHQGHSQRWHCRPRRHRENATGVVVDLHRGDDHALGKSCGRQHLHGLGRRGDRQKNLHSNGSRPCRMARHPGQPLRIFRQSQNQFHRSPRLFHFHHRSQSLAHRR